MTDDELWAREKLRSQLIEAVVNALHEFGIPQEDHQLSTVTGLAVHAVLDCIWENNVVARGALVDEMRSCHA